MSRNAQFAGSYYSRKANRSDCGFSVATVTFNVNANAGDTLTLEEVVLTFGTEIEIGATTNQTLLNLVGYLNDDTLFDGSLIFVVIANVLNIYSQNSNALNMSVTASAATVVLASTTAATTRGRIPL